MKTPLLSTLYCLVLSYALHAQNTSPYWSMAGNSNASIANKIGTTNNVSLRFMTNNIERLKIHSSGNVGIGVSTPLQKLHVGGNGVFTGNLGIGTTSPSKKLHVVGNSLLQGYTQITSKENTGLDVVAEYNTGNPEFDEENHTEVGIRGTGDRSGVEGYATYMNGTGVFGKGETGVIGEGLEYGVFGSGNFGIYGYTTEGFAGYFEGPVYSTSEFTASDQNLKKDITEVGDALSLIGQLKPKYYTFRNDGKYARLNLPKGNHYGLIAQQVEEVLPDLVKTTQHKLHQNNPGEQSENITIKAVNYTEIIPILVKGMQEQQQVIDQQKQELQELKNELADIRQLVSKLSGAQNINTYVSSAKLGEVSPNPVRGAATIQYAIPEDSYRPHLLITDASGRQIKAIQLSTSGVVNLDVSTLASGVYNYSLIVNFKTIDTKKMTVVK